MLFVAKVLYLLEPDCGDREGEVGEDVVEQAEGGPEEVKDGSPKPATLLWLIQKLSRMAKLEAAYSPRNPLKVGRRLRKTGISHFFKIYVAVVLVTCEVLRILPPETGTAAASTGTDKMGPRQNPAFQISAV